jgi:pilus assembly protein CpaC
VTLKVTVAEVQRTVMKQLGVNLLGNRSGDHGITFSGHFARASPARSASRLHQPASGLGASIAGMQLDAYFRAMEEAGVMKTLATPT